MAQTVKHLCAILETWVRSLGGEDPLEEEMATHSSLLPGESHGQRSLEGYSPRGHEESFITEHTHTLTLIVTMSKPVKPLSSSFYLG